MLPKKYVSKKISKELEDIEDSNLYLALMFGYLQNLILDSDKSKNLIQLLSAYATLLYSV